MLLLVVLVGVCPSVVDSLNYVYFVNKTNNWVGQLQNGFIEASPIIPQPIEDLFNNMPQNIRNELIQNIDNTTLVSNPDALFEIFNARAPMFMSYMRAVLPQTLPTYNLASPNSSAYYASILSLVANLVSWESS